MKYFTISFVFIVLPFYLNSQPMFPKSLTWEESISRCDTLTILFLLGEEAKKIDSRIKSFNNVVSIGLINRDSMGFPLMGPMQRIFREFNENWLISLPKEIGQLNTLKNLYIEGFVLKSLPDDFCKLVNLEELQIELQANENFESEILSISKLKKLKKLTLKGVFTDEQYDFIYSTINSKVEISTI